MKKKTLKFLITIVLAGCMLSCENRNVANVSMSDSSDLQKYMENVSLDSIFMSKSKTEEQLQIFNKVGAIYLTNIDIIDGKMVFLMTEDEFLAEGFPKSYYNSLMRDIDFWNHLIHLEDKRGVNHTKSMLCSTIPQFREQLEQGIKYSDISAKVRAQKMEQ
ncbi:MAG: hypothetical protein LBT50_01230 [Prevotellaceae bacterium]|jgi:hypothetical protein|nr:hypothetical protein [Prevotellaceae bacterium]